MSRWLNQVNSLLEKLDGQVETAAEEAPSVLNSVSARAVNLVQQTAAAATAATTTARRRRQQQQQPRRRPGGGFGGGDSGESASSCSEEEDDDDDDHDDGSSQHVRSGTDDDDDIGSNDNTDDEFYAASGESNDEGTQEEYYYESDVTTSDINTNTDRAATAAEEEEAQVPFFLDQGAELAAAAAVAGAAESEDYEEEDYREQLQHITQEATTEAKATIVGAVDTDTAAATEIAKQAMRHLPKQATTQPLFMNERVPTNDPILMPSQSPSSQLQESSRTDEQNHRQQQQRSTTIAPPPTAAAAPATDPSFMRDNKAAVAPSPPNSTKPPPPPSSAGKSNSISSNSNIKLIQQQQMQQLKKQHELELAEMLKQNEVSLHQVLKQNEGELSKVRQRNEQLQQDSLALRSELKALNQELQQAAVIVEQERAAAKEERDELLYEQEDELQQLKEEHHSQLTQLQSELSDQRREYQAKLAETEQQRLQLGGSMSAELHQAKAREQAAAAQVLELQQLNAQLQVTVVEWKEQYAAAHEQLEDATERLVTAEAAVAAAEERLDVTTSNHKKQLQQRLAREAALEQTVAELSHQTASASAAAIPSSTSVAETEHYHRSGGGTPIVVDERERLSAAVADYMERFQVATEELETVQSDLTLANQRCHALQQELADMSQERQREMTESQALLRDYDARLNELTLIANTHQQQRQQHLEQHNATTTEPTEATVYQQQQQQQQTQRELDQAKQQVASLSDQLLRQQGTAETLKSEVLALKGRLQVAISRAEAAERQQQASMVEIELGSPAGAGAAKRRVKGGRATRFGQLPSRSIRGAVGLQRQAQARGHSRVKQQIGDTIDAVDIWMIETGSILRHEPLARLCFALYLAIIHLWCFGLVFFHTIESEHGDLGQLTERSRMMGILQHQHPGINGV